MEAGATIVVMKNNKPVSVIAPLAAMERLDEIDDREENLRLLALALVRSHTTDGVLRDWDEVAIELGIDLTERAESDEDE